MLWTAGGHDDVNFTVAGLNVGLRPGAHTVEVLGLVGDVMPPGQLACVCPVSGVPEGVKVGVALAICVRVAVAQTLHAELVELAVPALQAGRARLT